MSFPAQWQMLTSKGANSLIIAEFHGDRRSRPQYRTDAICRPYTPEKHGQRQTVTVRFMTRDGFRDAHRYEMIHGTRWLRRVDPKSAVPM